MYWIQTTKKIIWNIFNNSALNICLIRIQLGGEKGTGKTSLINRYANNLTEDVLNKTGIDFIIKYTEVEQQTMKLQIWDVQLF